MTTLNIKFEADGSITLKNDSPVPGKNKSGHHRVKLNGCDLVDLLRVRGYVGSDSEAEMVEFIDEALRSRVN
jgi:hypothetical protein